MKIRCSRKYLLEELKNAKRVTAKRPIIPITGNIKLLAENGKLTLQSTNLKTGYTCMVDGAEIIKDGSTTVDANKITGVVSVMPGEIISISANDKDVITVSSDGKISRIKGLASNDFPGIDRFVSGFRMSAGKFTEIMSRVYRSAAQDDAREILNGVLIDVENGDVDFVSADGVRMSIYREVDMTPKDINVRVVIPVESARQIANTMSGEFVDIDVRDGYAIFKSRTSEVKSQVIDGEYPRYKEIIPTGHTAISTIDKRELNQALGITQFTVDDYTNYATFTFDEDKLNISMNSSTGDSSVDVNHEFSGKPTFVSLAVALANEVIRGCRTENVVIHVGSYNYPVVIKEDDTDSFIHILMPVIAE